MVSSVDSGVKIAVVLLALWTVVVGCAPEPPPVVDVAAVTSEVSELHESIAEALGATSETEGDVDLEDAHDMLHRMAYLLTKLGNLEAAPGIAPETCREIAQTAKEMGSAYDQLDSAIHKQETPDYGAVTDEISAAVARLNELMP